MQRRKFLIGVGSTSIGASALLGSGAFSRVESQRQVQIQVARDPNAYLGLDECPDSPNSSYTNIDEKGHLEIDMTPSNPTAADGTGVNSDSRTWFHNVFQICNQGKDEVCIWIGDDDDWPWYTEDERRVDFYIGDDDTQSIIGEENAYVLAVGECVCIGIKTVTKGLGESEKLLDALTNEIVIYADVDCPENGEARGETAWAIERENDGTENRLNELTNVNRWGWYIPYSESDGTVDSPLLADLIAGAGLNDPDRGDDVADVEIYDDGDDLFIDIEMEADWSLDSSEVFVGRLRDDDSLQSLRAAPGRFPYKSTDADQDADSYHIRLGDIPRDGDGNFVIAIHADVSILT